MADFKFFDLELKYTLLIECVKGIKLDRLSYVRFVGQGFSHETQH
jgi:hypothetical protein